VSANRQGGQALTEFLGVAAFLLLPLFLLIPLLASLLSQKQDMEIAARYAAWERTVWHRSAPAGPGQEDTVKSDEQVAHEIDARIFARDDQPLVSGRNEPLAIDTFSSRPHDGTVLVKDVGEGTESGTRWATQTASASEPSGLVGLSDATVGALGSFTRFDLETRGLFDAQVSLELVDLRGMFGLPDAELDALRLRRDSRLFVEAWTGGEKRNVEYRVSGLLPQQYMDSAEVRNVQDFAAFAPGAREIRSDWLEFGHVDIDPLPSHRLGPQAPDS
jgi:hypothetical protein